MRVVTTVPPPCAICGKPATQEGVEITPAQEGTRTVVGKNGLPLTAKVIVRPAVKVNLCAIHHRHHLEQRGWQEREEEKRKRNTRAAKERLKRDQLGLFGGAA